MTCKKGGGCDIHIETEKDLELARKREYSRGGGAPLLVCIRTLYTVGGELPVWVYEFLAVKLWKKDRVRGPKKIK